MIKKEIEFLRKKDYKFLKNIGKGGLGETVLLRDDIIGEEFICKKYSPYYDEHREKYFSNFIDEIKLLHKIYHSNIVRVYNYYLYPQQFTGYIIMEFIDGTHIEKFANNNPHLISNLFEQTINGFCHLEECKILHRDIRPENIMVSKDGLVKIIDFGFGKKINFEENFNKSISLNWRFTPPQDFEDHIYDFKTEIYFVGKLFEQILKENNIEDFTYKAIISSMIENDYSERIGEFRKIQTQIYSNSDLNSTFSDEEKEIYKSFASYLTSLLSSIESSTTYITDIMKIISGLEVVLRNSMLEDYIQNPVSISRVFLSGNYTFFRKSEFPVLVLSKFIQLLKSVSSDKQMIILNNLWQRLDNVDKSKDYDDGLPF